MLNDTKYRQSFRADNFFKQQLMYKQIKLFRDNCNKTLSQLMVPLCSSARVCVWSVLTLPKCKPAMAD